MNRSICQLCLYVCLLLILMPIASAACIGNVVWTPVETYSPPGPYGSIYVESYPSGAVISMNDANQGHAPVTITGLWPGTYTIKAELAGYEDFTSTTTISGATRSSVYCPLVPENSGTGLYIVSTPEKASVYIDGISKGVTPLMLDDPATGSHSIEIRLYGYGTWKSTIDVHVGGTKTISAILNQEDSDSNRGIHVSSKPAGAKVILDGLAKGYTPLTLNSIASGIHILEIENPDYVSWKSTVDIPETGIKEISINLTPGTAGLLGWITISSSPENALVTLDGSYVGRTTLNNTLNLDAITPGEHTIALALAGYTPYSTRITAVSNQVSVVNATLIPISDPFEKGGLSVTSEPAGATILVDNKSIGISPVTVNDIAAGNHQVTFRMEGYQDYSGSVFVTAGTTSVVSVTLLPATRVLHSPVFPLAALGALGIIWFITLRKRE
jgi:hypothetical protein